MTNPPEVPHRAVGDVDPLRPVIRDREAASPRSARVPTPWPSPRVSLRTEDVLRVSLVGWGTALLVAVVRWNLVLLPMAAAGASLSVGLLLWLRRRPTDSAGVAHVMGAIASLVLAIACVITGQGRSPLLWFFVSIPPQMAYLRDLRAAKIWAGVSAVIASAIVISGKIRPIASLWPVDEIDILIAVLVLGMMILGFVASGARVHQEQIQTARARESTIRDLADGLETQTRQITEARDAALAASRAKSEFVATISHEIRTPLNGVLGTTGLLLDGPLSPEQEELVRTIRASADTLLYLINDILDFSKIEAGKLDIEHEPFDVAACVEDALDLFSVAATDKGIDLASRIDPQVPSRLVGDGGRVRQILVNLIGNAIKFTDRGEVEIAVTSSPAGGDDIASADGDVLVKFAIRDTGIGIPADRMSLLFKPFSQADATTTRQFGGTGLGLAISKRLAEMMGGHAWAESQEGIGSVFYFTFRTSPDVAPSERVDNELDRKAVAVLCEKPLIAGMLADQATALSLFAHTCDTVDELVRLVEGRRVDLAIIGAPLFRDAVRMLSVAAAPLPPLLAVTHRSGERLYLPNSTLAPVLRRPARRADLRRMFVQLFGHTAQEEPAVNKPSPISDRPLRILLAEDNATNQRVAMMLLERLGHRADVCANGMEALEAVQTRAYDVIFMDVRMPVMDGLEAARVIRAKLADDRQPRIVAMTANALKEDREACEAAGMDDFVPKPIVLASIKDALAKVPRLPSGPSGDPVESRRLAALRSITRASPGAFRALVEEFLAAGDELIDAIDAGLMKSDFEAVREAAHALKGSSGQLGAAHVSFQSAALERAASKQEADEAIALARELRVLFEQAKVHLRAAVDAAVSSKP